MKKTSDGKYCLTDGIKMIRQLILEKNLLENASTKGKGYTKKDYIKYFERLENLLSEIDDHCIMIYGK